MRTVKRFEVSTEVGGLKRSDLVRASGVKTSLIESDPVLCSAHSLAIMIYHRSADKVTLGRTLCPSRVLRLIGDICEDRVRACGAVKCIAASKRDKEDCRGSKRPIESNRGSRLRMEFFEPFY